MDGSLNISLTCFLYSVYPPADPGRMILSVILTIGKVEIIVFFFFSSSFSFSLPPFFLLLSLCLSVSQWASYPLNPVALGYILITFLLAPISTNVGLVRCCCLSLWLAHEQLVLCVYICVCLCVCGVGPRHTEALGEERKRKEVWDTSGQRDLELFGQEPELCCGSAHLCLNGINSRPCWWQCPVPSVPCRVFFSL
jgi:hypothetical protein